MRPCLVSNFLGFLCPPGPVKLTISLRESILDLLGSNLEVFEKYDILIFIKCKKRLRPTRPSRLSRVCSFRLSLTINRQAVLGIG